MILTKLLVQMLYFLFRYAQPTAQLGKQDRLQVSRLLPDTLEMGLEFKIRQLEI
jgi:hypothetical protein